MEFHMLQNQIWGLKMNKGIKGGCLRLGLLGMFGSVKRLGMVRLQLSKKKAHPPAELKSTPASTSALQSKPIQAFSIMPFSKSKILELLAEKDF